MKIAITGANGYIGSNLVKKCLEMGHDVLAIDIRNDFIDCRAKFIELNIFSDIDILEHFKAQDALIHLAWRNGFVHNDISHLNDLDKHYSFLTSIIDSGIKYISVLGTMHEIGYHEGAIDENTICNPLSLYGISKNALRQAVMLYTKGKYINFSWLRAYYIVGDDSRSNSIFGKLLKKVQDGEKSFPLNSGKIKYDFIDIDKFCSQIVCATLNDKINGVINVCSGIPMSLGERVEQFISENNLDIELQYGVFPDRPYDSPCVYGDSTKIDIIMNKENL